MRLIGYARASKDEQELSLGVQETRLRAWAVAHDVELVDICFDAGVSGTVVPKEREGFRELLRRLRAKEADGFVVMRLDRLARRAVFVHELAELCEKTSWRLVIMDISLDTSTPMGAFVLGVLALLAQLERDQIAERTREALAEIRRQGRSTSRFTPFGWRTADGAAEVLRGDRRLLVEHAGELAALHEISVLRASGLGPRRIARALRMQHVANPRTGQWWNHRAVGRALAGLEKA